MGNYTFYKSFYFGLTSLTLHLNNVLSSNSAVNTGYEQFLQAFLIRANVNVVKCFIWLHLLQQINTFHSSADLNILCLFIHRQVMSFLIPSKWWTGGNRHFMIWSLKVENSWGLILSKLCWESKCFYLVSLLTWVTHLSTNKCSSRTGHWTWDICLEKYF